MHVLDFSGDPIYAATGLIHRVRPGPKGGPLIVLLHGLGACHLMMDLMAGYLREKGHYEIINVTYPSTRRDVAGHARALAHIVKHLDGIEQIDIVAHSLGNIIVRHWLADRTIPAASSTRFGVGQPAPPATCQGDPRLRRMVMLGPPNQGSIAAMALADTGLFTVLAGPPGQELGRQWSSLESRLATPRFEFGIIAGGQGTDAGFNRLLPGDNDGLVTVASTRLEGARDFLLLPVLHPRLPDDSRVMQATLSFLQNGYFTMPDARHPIP